MKVSDTRVDGRDTTLLLERRIKLTAMALLFILLSLLGFAAITLRPEILSALSEINLNYSAYVRLTNSILALICAAFLLWPREGGRLVGRWNDYVGVAFLTFFVLYGVRFVAVLLKSQFPRYQAHINVGTDIVVYLGSYFNNILFLAAARILLNKNRRLPESQPVTVNAGAFQHLKQEWVVLRAALPSWYWIMFPVSLLALLENFAPTLLWVRFPDTIFSVYCLSWFAYALWLSFRVRRLMTLTWLGFILVLAYAAGQLVYASNPFIAYSLAEHGTPSRPPGSRVGGYLGQKVVDEISKNTKPPKEFFEGAKEFFDGAIFAILAPMKSLLFLPPFILYLLSIISVNDFRQALRETTSKRMDYLSKDGILCAIGRSMGADEVRLIIRLPGVKRRQHAKEERVIAEVWGAPGTPPVKKGPRIYPLEDDDLLIRAMQTEGKAIIVTNEDAGEVAASLRETGPHPQTLALIPIKFHGGAIGALKVIFRGYGKYNSGTLEQLKFMAELIAPSVQDFRTVSAVDKLGARLSRAQASKPNDSFLQGDRLTNGFKTAAEKMVGTLYDLLNPLSVGLLLECGFTSVKPIFPKEGTYYEILMTPKVGYHELGKREIDHGEKPVIILRTDAGPVRIEHDPLSVKTEKGIPFDLGSLVLALPQDRDEFAQPTLAAYYLTRRMLASLTAHGIFNAARNSLGVVIQDLGVALNSETLSVTEWFDNVEAATRKSGLLWVVTSEGDSKPLRGRPENVKIVTGLAGADSENLISKPLGCIPHRTPGSATCHIIHLQLKDPGHRIWLGVERAEFGRELNFQSPWKGFLEKLANVAGTALVRIEERHRTEVRRKKEEAERLKEAEDEWLKSTADFGAMLMHQLVNMADNLRASAGDLLESVGGRPLSLDAESLASITDMKKNADMMMEMTSAYKKATEMGTPCACYIDEAAQQTKKLFQFALRKKEIKLEIDVLSGVSAKAPTPVVTLTLAALTYNAIDAIRSRGTIKIRAEEKEDVVCCQVINSGPPIPDEIMPDLFRPGAKGKKEHSGLGLYFVSRSLSNYKGEIELSYSRPEETCFTFRLPVLAN